MNASKSIYFYAPSLKKYINEHFSNVGTPYIVPVSITGRRCALMCKHCEGKILHAMHEVLDPPSLLSFARSMKEEGVSALLVSGGSTKEGKVPLEPFFGAIKRIKEEIGMKVLVHAQGVDSSFAKGLKEAKVDIVLIDIIGSDATVKEVYHLPFGKEFFRSSLENLCSQALKVVPHVVVGLHWGRVEGEYEALGMIHSFPVEAVVLVGLFPQRGTKMEMVRGPQVKEWKNLFLHARSLFEEIPLLLGCQRSPFNKEEVEKVAVMCGVDAVAYPCEETIELAKEMGLCIHFSKHCCASLIDETP